MRPRIGLMPPSLDPVIHERTRLAIVGAIAGRPAISFSELRALLQTTDGNLSAHARKLEEAGYIRSRKKFAGRLPRTQFYLTPAGNRALKRYVGQMETILAALPR